MVLDLRGKPLSERVCTRTPKNATPKALLGLSAAGQAQQRIRWVAVGFPGVAKDGPTRPRRTWARVGRVTNSNRIEPYSKAPTRVADDADVQGLDVSGRGIELVITLGTGVGSVLFADGQRIIWNSRTIRLTRARATRTNWAIAHCSRRARGSGTSSCSRRLRDLRRVNYHRLISARSIEIIKVNRRASDDREQCDH